MNDHPTLRLSTPEALIISTAGAVGGIAYLIGRGISIPSAVVISVCGGAVLAGMLILGIEKSLEDLQQRLIARPAHVLVVVAALWGLYLAYSIGTNTARFQPLFVMAIYLSVPFFLLKERRGLLHATWRDAVTILWIWLPIELGLIRRVLISSAPDTDFHYGFAQALAVNMGVIAFAAWRRFPGIGYRFELDRNQVSVALFYFSVFAAIAIPLGFAIHFIRYSFEVSKLAFAPAAFLGIYLLVAVPEEVLFRGLIQNWFERVTTRRIVSLMLASIVFGAAHLNNGPPIPNYRYFLMASIAGIFYGLVWRRTGSVAASAITHALVDTVWSALFR
jgi:membrane protease YdiL (CAAX protease family)